MSNKTLNLTDDLYAYCLQMGLREHPVLTELRAITAELPGAIMQIAPDQGQFMQLLIKLMQAKRTLDIGCFTGYSALSVALALPDDGQVYTFDVDEKVTSVAKAHWQKAGVADKVQLKLGPASASLRALIDLGEAGQFDFAFIDADKRGYLEYYELALELLRPGGLIAVDNALRDGGVIDPNDNSNATKTIRALNEKIHQDERVDICLLVTGDGLFLARKK